MDAGNGGTMWNLYLAFIDCPDGVIGRAQYNSDIFQEETIAQMLTDLEMLLKRCYFAAALAIVGFIQTGQ